MAKNEQADEVLKPVVGSNKIIARTSADFMGYKGSTPFIEVDENWVQMPLDRTKLTVPREHLTRMFPLAYFAGKLSGLEQGNKLGLVAIITICLLIAGLGFTWMMNSGTQKQVQDLSGSVGMIANNTADMSDTVNVDHQLIQMVAVKLNITMGNNTIPTVGG